MNVLLVVLLILLIFGAGYGGHWGWTTHGPLLGSGIGVVGILVIVLVVLLLTGRL